MISIHTAAADPDLVAEFRTWVEAEWKNVNPFEDLDGKALPSPILAVEDGVLAGGLSFTYSPLPGTQDLALWINTVLVAPGLRRRGIGSKLVSAAERSAGAAGVDVLYVFTEVAGLYQKLGWQEQSDTGRGKVLRKQVVP